MNKELKLFLDLFKNLMEETITSYPLVITDWVEWDSEVVIRYQENNLP